MKTFEGKTHLLVDNKVVHLTHPPSPLPPLCPKTRKSSIVQLHLFTEQNTTVSKKFSVFPKVASFIYDACPFPPKLRSKAESSKTKKNQPIQ